MEVGRRVGGGGGWGGRRIFVGVFFLFFFCFLFFFWLCFFFLFSFFLCQPGANGLVCPETPAPSEASCSVMSALRPRTAGPGGVLVRRQVTRRRLLSRWAVGP